MSALGFLDSTDVASLVLRLFIGILFVVHGWAKIRNPKQAAAWVKSTGRASAARFAYAFTFLEFFGGIALVTGFLPRTVAILFVLQLTAPTVLQRGPVV